MTSSDLTMLSNYEKLPYLSTRTWYRGKLSVVYYVFIGQKYIDRTLNFNNLFFNNTVFFKMAANMADKSYMKKYLSAQTWQRNKFSVEYCVFMDQEFIACIFNFDNNLFFKIAANMVT